MRKKKNNNIDYFSEFDELTPAPVEAAADPAPRESGITQELVQPQDKGMNEPVAETLSKREIRRQEKAAAAEQKELEKQKRKEEKKNKKANRSDNAKATPQEQRNASAKTEKPSCRKTAKTPIKGHKKSSKIATLKSTQIFSPIREVRDGIIITKDGDFIKLLEFSSINFMLRNESEKDSIIMQYMSVIKLLPNNVQFKIISRKADITEFIQKISDNMATEPSPNCRRLQRQQIKLIRELGAQQAITRRFVVAFKYEEENKALSQHTEWEDVVSSLNNIAGRIISAMKKIGNECLSEDTTEYTLSLLYSIMSRNQYEDMTLQERITSNVLRYMVETDSDTAPKYLPVNDLICPSYIDSKNSRYLVIDGLYYAFAYVPSSSYPRHAVAGWTSLFTNLGEGIDVDIFLNKQDGRSSQIKLQYALRMNKIQLRSTEDTSLDYEEKQDTVSSGYYLKDGLSSGDDFCYMSMLLTITARSKDALLAKCEEIKNFCFTLEMPIKMANFQHEQAFLSSLPICALDKNIYTKSRRNILGSDFASTYPFSSYEISDKDGFLWGINQSNNSLVFLNNFDAKIYPNPNIIILGMSGSGKSYTLMLTAIRMREDKNQVFIIAPDKGHEFKRLCDAIGGTYINLSAGSEDNINPLEIRKKDLSVTRLIDGEDMEQSHLIQKVQQVETLISLMVPDINHEERQLVDEAILQTYQKFGITKDNDSLIDPDNPDQYRKMPILGDIHEALKAFGKRTERITTILSRYVTGSAASINTPTNVDLDNKFVVLDISSMTDDMKPIGMFIALDYVWDKTREDRTKKKAIIIDEVWQLIGQTASERSAKFVVQVFKVIRAYGGCAIAATQDLEDFFGLADGFYGKNIINNSKIKFIMKLEKTAAEAVQSSAELTDAEVEELTRFDSGEGILVANTNHVIVQVKASSYEHDLITTRMSDLERLAERSERKG